MRCCWQLALPVGVGVRQTQVFHVPWICQVVIEPLSRSKCSVHAVGLSEAVERPLFSLLIPRTGTRSCEATQATAPPLAPPCGVPLAHPTPPYAVLCTSRSGILTLWCCASSAAARPGSAAGWTRLLSRCLQVSFEVQQLLTPASRGVAWYTYSASCSVSEASSN